MQSVATAMIISAQNPKVKRIRRLLNDRRYRHHEGAYVVEGTRWLAEVAASGIGPELVLATASWLRVPGNSDLADKLAAPVVQASEEVMAWASDAQSPPGVLLVLPIVPRPLPEHPTLLLIVDGLRNPGNLGSVLRTAAAAGADGVGGADKVAGGKKKRRLGNSTAIRDAVGSPTGTLR